MEKPQTPPNRETEVPRYPAVKIQTWIRNLGCMWTFFSETLDWIVHKKFYKIYSHTGTFERNLTIEKRETARYVNALFSRECGEHTLSEVECSSVLQCVAVRCSVLQLVAVYFDRQQNLEEKMFCVWNLSMREPALSVTCVFPKRASALKLAGISVDEHNPAKFSKVVVSWVLRD
jgi:hypothetical protein